MSPPERSSRRMLIAAILALIPGTGLSRSSKGTARPQTPSSTMNGDAIPTATGEEARLFLQSGRGAVTRGIADRLRDTLSVLDYVPAALRDDVLAGIADATRFIQAALDHAGSLAIDRPTFPGYAFVQAGGAGVYLPAGRYRTSATLILPQNVSLTGAGKHSTVIHSTASEAILRNTGTPSRTGTYDEAGIAIRDISFIGVRSQADQVGLAFLRLTSATIENISVEQCGSDGIRLYQCGANQFDNVESVYNQGDGLRIGSGFDRWTDRKPNDLPSNANIFSLYRGMQNGGPGIRLGQGSNGNVFFAATCENNYFSVADLKSCNVRVESNDYSPNCFYDLWTEGNCQAHVISACPDVSVMTKLVNWKHFGDGADGKVGRALIVQGGTVMLDAPYGTGASYRLLDRSTAPFRITDKSRSAIYVVNARGASVAGAKLVDDSTGKTTGFFDNLRQDCTAVDGVTYGDIVHVGDAGSAGGWAVRGDGDAFPRLVSRGAQRDLLFGNGAEAPDAGLKRTAPRQVGPRDGDFLNVGSAWNGSHLVMGVYHLWVDATGALRIKRGPPHRDADGAPMNLPK